MKFGPVPVADAEGCVLAHSLRVSDVRFAKGMALDSKAIARLAALNVTEVVVAQLDHTDIDENTAAAALGKPFASDLIDVTPAFAGRVNLVAKSAGVLRVDAAMVNALNQIDESITFACLPDYARVAENALLGTFKIIPYAVDKKHLSKALACISTPFLQLHPFKNGAADLILTQTQGFKKSLLDKGRDAVAARLLQLGWRLGTVQTVAHSTDAVAQAVNQTTAEMVLILGASATSDRLDVAPAGLVAAGGRVNRFGMPVDPGNLLFIGEIKGRAVVGLPGCVRAPALNGVDWVLERLAAGVAVSAQDIAAMGVGGLLKEIPQRIQPRRAARSTKGRTIEIILLAAGKSSRMGGQHKLLREIDGVALLRRSAEHALASKASKLHVILAPETPAQNATLKGLDVNIVTATDAGTGLAASLRAGMAALSDQCGAVIVALADMPDITSAHFDALIAHYTSGKTRYICIPQAPNGKMGNPVLFDQRFFESLASLTGDRGAKPLIDQAGAFVSNVPMDDSVLVDLDTPAAWDLWLSTRK